MRGIGFLLSRSRGCCDPSTEQSDRQLSTEHCIHVGHRLLFRLIVGCAIDQQEQAHIPFIVAASSITIERVVGSLTRSIKTEASVRAWLISAELLS